MINVYRKNNELYILNKDIDKLMIEQIDYIYRVYLENNADYESVPINNVSYKALPYGWFCNFINSKIAHYTGLLTHMELYNISIDHIMNNTDFKNITHVVINFYKKIQEREVNYIDV